MTSKAKTVVVALGGNALQRQGEATAAAQQRVADETAQRLVPLIEKGYRIVIVHGNGPQVGNIVLHEESIDTPETPTLPLDTCVAMSQGSIGYWLQQGLSDALSQKRLPHTAVTIITQVVVDASDRAFQHPTKPIGPFYHSELEAEHAAKERHFTVREDAGRGWRRVVPSPRPVSVVEKDAIVTLLDSGSIVITAGGGGVPVVSTKKDGLKGIEAVIDKDFSAAVIADLIEADSLVILTAVEAAMIDYGKPTQRAIHSIHSATMQSYVSQGFFAAGSMLPKVQAALQFVEAKNGRRAIIANLDDAERAISGEVGTVIHS